MKFLFNQSGFHGKFSSQVTYKIMAWNYLHKHFWIRERMERGSDNKYERIYKVKVQLDKIMPGNWILNSRKVDSINA